jgi:hypothetical protein
MLSYMSFLETKREGRAEVKGNERGEDRRGEEEFETTRVEKRA